MKNFKLLLATTAILSTGALAVLADPTPVFNNDTVSPVIYAEAIIIKPLTVSSSSEEPINFGSMVFEKGKYVTINTAGEIDTNASNATTYDVQRRAARVHLSGTGTIGNMIYGMNNDPEEEYTDDELTADISPYITFTIPDITLTAENNINCGKVDSFEQKYHLANDGIDVYIGGKFTMSNNDITMPASGFLNCSGNVTATLVFPRDLY